MLLASASGHGEVVDWARANGCSGDPVGAQDPGGERKDHASAEKGPVREKGARGRDEKECFDKDGKLRMDIEDDEEDHFWGFYDDNIDDIDSLLDY